MKQFYIKILFVVCLTTTFTYGQTYTSGMFSIGSAVDGQIDINTSNNMVTMTLIGPDDAYFGIGLDTADGHINGKDVAIYIQDGSLSDRTFTNNFEEPPLDAQQDWTVTNNTTDLGMRTIVATRARDTGDANDYAFSTTPTTLDVVGSQNNNFTLNHHADAAISSISFSLLGVDDSDLITFSMSPNPANTTLKIVLPSTNSTFRIDVFDVMGRAIFNNNIQNSHWSVVDVSSWSSGMYLVKITNGNSTQTKRLIKQ